MLTENDVLLILHKDSWFTPSSSEIKKEIVDDDGNKILVAESYYRNLLNGSQIIIRVSNHGTYLNTWVKRRNDPSASLQNLSVVFSNEPVVSKLEVEPVEMQDSSGKIVKQNLYFVVEQYVYKMDNLSKKDFLKFIKKLKVLDDKTVFKDPFKKKPAKRAYRRVLVPKTDDGKDVPPSNNPVHSRQTIVANNKDYEVDAEGNIIPEQLMKQIAFISICETKKFLRNIISENRKTSVRQRKTQNRGHIRFYVR